MKKMTLLAALAALASLVSCQKEEAVNGNGEMKVIYPEFTASIGTEETKTTVNLSGGKVSWESSDTIIVSDGTNSAVYKVKSIDGTSGNATFEVKDNTQPILGSGPYTATYGTGPSTSQTYSATAGRLYMTAPLTSDKSFTFTVECGLMKLTLTKTGESVKSIAVTGTPTGGSQTTYILTCETAESIDAAKDFCIALPAGDYNKLVITDNASKVCTLNASNALSVNANKIRPVIISDTKLIFLPEGALSGLFSVSTDKKVRFSKGNLRYTVASAKWDFYDNQYDFCNTSIYAGHHADTISLFTWGYDATKSIIPDGSDSDNVSRTSGNLSQSEDWGCTIGDGKTWRTLTKDEWEYLLSSSGRGDGDSKFKQGVEVAGKSNCLIIAPDGYTGEIADTYSAEQWTAAESQGLVCLPAAGCRNGSKVYDVGNFGEYWSSTPVDEDTAFYIVFDGMCVYLEDNADYSRYNGYSVRLVYSAQ